MRDNLIQVRFLEAVKNLRLKFPVAEISAKMGVGLPVVSTYLNSKRIVSDNFLKTFCKSYGLDYESIRHGGEAAEQEDSASGGDYRAKYIGQLEKENKYLQEIVSTNLTLVLATVRTLSVRQLAVGEIVLDSLERLEGEIKPKKKAQGLYVASADRRIDQIEREAFARGSEVPMSR